MNKTQVIDIMKMIWPIIVIQLTLQIYAIVDIAKRRKTKNLSPAIWIVVIIFGEIIGSIIYLLFGKSED